MREVPRAAARLQGRAEDSTAAPRATRIRHRGAFKQDCSSCHNETGFGRGTFDHATGTSFALTGTHAPLDLREVPQDARAAGAGRGPRRRLPRR